MIENLYECEFFLNVIQLLVTLFLFITLNSLQQHRAGTQQFSHKSKLLSVYKGEKLLKGEKQFKF